MSITSDELNFLIYRYLHESGFRHSAFTFGCESMVTKSNINGSKIAPGELVNLVQRGIMYTELERSVGEDGSDLDSAPYSLTTSSRESKQQREQQQQQQQQREQQLQQQQQQQQRGSSDRGGSVGRAVQQSGAAAASDTTEAMAVDADGSRGGDDVQAMAMDDEVTNLIGHASEVFICAWSPKGLKLASGSGDATARIWTVPDGPCGQGRDYPPPVVLHHVSGDKEKSKDVTTLDWNSDGSLLATGSYDGQARIWSPEGQLLHTLSRHKGPIFSLKWNSTGQYLLSGSVDKTAVVWDTTTSTVKQEFAFHKEPTLDVDWRDEDSFASCSTDRMIYVCKLNSPNYLRCFQGHRDEVNAIKWDPSGSLLASCSDDHTAKIWTLKGDACVQDLREHQKEIYTIKWSPGGPGSANPNASLVLATGSFDATVRLWDPETGQCSHVLDKHLDPVYSVAFSADGRFLASGSFDRCLHIWSVKDGSLVKTYRGTGGIFEVCWNSDGTKVAACFSSNVVSVLDMRM